jgi:pimeloyl-ACP methyl ester carboxylesterase
LSGQPAVVLLHGWPGLPNDYRRLIPMLDKDFRVVVPDLLGFGAGFTGPVDYEDATADAHARRVLSALHAEGIEDPVLAGYNMGSRIAQAMARAEPSSVRGLVITPGYPGIGARAAHPEHLPRIDGSEKAVRTYLTDLWREWAHDPKLVDDAGFEAVVSAYARPGAFTASLSWFRANPGSEGGVSRVTVPTTMLWPEEDPIFPIAWADALGEWFANYELVAVPSCGHCLPLEAPEVVAAAIRERTLV